MKKLGSKRMTLVLQEPLAKIPEALAEWQLKLKPGGNELEYIFDIKADHTGVPSLLRRLSDFGIAFRDLATEQSSLEDIFVSLVSERGGRQ
jgi:ABC-2 type transport system ATP-binding protein